MQFRLVLAFFFLTCVFADVYLHNPRGSNNRLNERTATRTNGNRLFDSQNNNRGGYNVGEKTTGTANTEDNQYYMKYFTSHAAGGQSELTLEWTNQHGCGGSSDKDPHKLNCEVVLQFMCASENAKSPRNGVNTGTPNANQENANSGQHEPLAHFTRCTKRNRNRGLFTADQKVGNSARNTRQNPNGNQNGYECPEERDYYPYWHPSPWIDIAVLTDNVSRCDFYKKESFNKKPRGECVVANSRNVPHNTPATCTAGGGQWVEFQQYLEKASDRGCKYRMGVPWDSANPSKKECLVPPPNLDCQSAPWSRSNHLGDTRGEGHAMRYTWKLPVFPSGETKRCALRVRYNISTDDYDPWRTNSSWNGEKSPVKNNPLVQISPAEHPLRLAINTAQTGRTFQDRSHVFLLARRPDAVPTKSRLINLNVRGKRGNIVQVYPAVEYDFIPNRLRIKENDLVHLQWTGSNSHNNGGNGGDGQAGDDGQGTGGTDRSNFVEMADPADNFPTPFEFANLFNSRAMSIVWSSYASKSVKDAAIQAASSGYFQCQNKATCGANSVESKAAMNRLLNNATPSFAGFIFSLKKGTYHYMCTRNNNFSNRSQKGHIIVS